MGLFDWFKTLASGKDEAEPIAAAPLAKTEAPDTSAESGIVAGLDFKGAINAHIAWKVRLEKCITGDNEENLQVEVVPPNITLPHGR